MPCSIVSVCDAAVPSRCIRFTGLWPKMISPVPSIFCVPPSNVMAPMSDVLRPPIRTVALSSEMPPLTLTDPVVTSRSPASVSPESLPPPLVGTSRAEPSAS